MKRGASSFVECGKVNTAFRIEASTCILDVFAVGSLDVDFRVVL